MSKINYKKFKISIDPESTKVQGLKENDIVIRQYVDYGNVFYTLMVVLSTGTEKVVINGKDKLKKWFVGGMLYGDEPKTDEILDFVRITSLSEEDRMGSLYLTGSDSDAPYMDIVDNIGAEKSLNLPSQYNEDYTTYNKNSYSAIINGYGTVQYLFRNDNATRAFKLTRNSIPPSTSGLAGSFKCLIPTLREGDFQDSEFLISFKYRSSLNISVPYKISDLDGSHENMPQQLLQSTPEWKNETAVFIVSSLSNDNYFHFGAIASWAAGTWIEIAELNIIPIRSLVSWSESVKSRFGKLTGIADSVFGTLKDYGSYTQRLYASKDVNISGTLTAGDANGFGSTFYVGKIRKNEIINSLSPEFRAGNNDFTIDTSSFNPVGIGTIYSKKIKAGKIEGDIYYQTKQWINSHVKNQYTLSFWAKSNINDKKIEVYNDGAIISTFTLNKDWSRYSVSYAITSTLEETVKYTFSLVAPSSSDELFICALQLESGINSTAYQPTDETLSSSEAYGAWMCRGGVGGTIQNPLLTFRSDGSIYGKNGNFHILPNGDAEFRGKVTVVGTGSNVPTRGEIDTIVGDALAEASLDFNDEFAKKLGYANYVDMTEAAIAGKTVIKGGFINTVLLDAEVIRATIIKTSYIEGLILNFTKGTIGGFNIDATKLYAGAADYTGGHLAIEKNQGGGRFMASIDGGNYCKMFFYHADDWGFKGVKNGIELFSFGNITQIAGWNFTDKQITSPSGKLILSSFKSSIGVFKLPEGKGGSVELQYTSETDWGLRGLLEDGRDVFTLGSTNRIAGWNIDPTKIYTNNIELGSLGYIRQVQNKWRLNSDGSGSLANGSIYWDAEGNAVFTGTVIVAGVGPGVEDEETVTVVGDEELEEAVEESKDIITSGLGYANFQEFMKAAIAGKTVIQGGYINAVLLDADVVRATIIKTSFIEGISLNFIKGTVGGWALSDNQLYNGVNETGSNNSMIRLSNVNFGSGYVYMGTQIIRGLSLTWNQENNSGHLGLGQIMLNPYTKKDYFFGLQMMDHVGKEYFCLSANTSATYGEKLHNSIAGWRFDETKLYSGSIEIVSSGLIRVTSDKWRFNSDGSGKLADGNIIWDINGNVTFSNKVSLSWSSGIEAAKGAASNAQLSANEADKKAAGAALTANNVTNTVNNVILPKTTKITSDGVYTGTLVASQITSGIIDAARINVSGIVTAEAINALTCTFAKGTIGGWAISPTSISKGNTVLSADGSIYNGTQWSLNKDGSGFLANNNISWDANGANFKLNKITATSGNIGSFNIQNGGLSWSKNNNEYAISFLPEWYSTNFPGPIPQNYNVALHLKMPLSNTASRPLFVDGCAEFYGRTIFSGSIMTRGFSINISDNIIKLTSSIYLFENNILGISNKNDILVYCTTPGLALYLPKMDTIHALTSLSWKDSWSMKITIVAKSNCSQMFRVEPGLYAMIIDNNANMLGFVNMALGDVLELFIYHVANDTKYNAQIINHRS